MKATVDSQTDFGCIFREFVKGEKQIESLLEHPEFIRRTRRFCRLLQGSEDGADELFQDVCLKVFKNRESLRAHQYPDERYPDERSFFAWVLMVTRSASIDAYRKNAKPTIEFTLEDINLPDPRVDLEGHLLSKDRLEAFENYIKTLPTPRQHAIALWAKGYSSRQIEEILRGEGTQFSHVTVLTWIKRAVNSFLNETEANHSKQKAAS